ncbi:hypothetical protein J2S77_001838 [Alkalibacillus salilacus]|uniref:Uncharacterized protein n=1 Tax=Alkalibacillus salilacus TaxID=284582 RepID=A0ABT9VFX1_9BACI|nr:hypothetical protein [Alkalibacillus salilacus]
MPTDLIYWFGHYDKTYKDDYENVIEKVAM